MANAVRIRAELKKKYNDPDRNFKELHNEFQRKVRTAGIKAELKDHEFYQSKSEINRNKKRETTKRLQMESLEKKILAGEKIDATPGLVKKVMAKINNDKKDKRKYKQKDRASDKYS